MSQKPNATVDFPENFTALSILNEDYALLKQFADEQGIANPAEAVGVLLREHQRITDKLWDEAFARTPDRHIALDDLIAEVQADADAGRTEELTDDIFDR